LPTGNGAARVVDVNFRARIEVGRAA